MNIQARGIKAVMLSLGGLFIIIVMFILIFNFLVLLLPLVIIIFIISYLFKILRKFNEDNSEEYRDIKFKINNK